MQRCVASLMLVFVAACGDSTAVGGGDTGGGDSAVAETVAAETSVTGDETVADTGVPTASETVLGSETAADDTLGDTSVVETTVADSVAETVDETALNETSVDDTSVDETSVDETAETTGGEVVESPLVGGADLVLEDVSEDGLYLAYTDAAHNLYHVQLAGGAPALVSTGVDRARYKGKFLMVYKGLGATGDVAGTMLVVPEGTVSPSLTTAFVKVNTVIASPDGNHYAFERLPSDGATTADVYLDGTRLFADATTSRQAFSPTSNYLVASDFFADPSSGTKYKVVRAYPVAGGAPKTLVADGAASRFSIAPNGQQVVVGFNDSGPQADLTVVPITGGAGTLLMAAARDKDFRVMEDGATLIFMDLDTSGLNRIGLDGSGLGVVVGAAVADLDATSSTLVIYATDVDNATGFKALRAVKKDGTKDTALGDLAQNEGFTPDEAYFTYRSEMLGDEGSLGVLVVATMKASQFATGVVKSSVADNDRVVYLDSAGSLKQAALATGAKTAIADHVTTFRLVSDGLGMTTKGRVAFVVGVGVPGIYVTTL